MICSYCGRPGILIRLRRDSYSGLWSLVFRCERCVYEFRPEGAVAKVRGRPTYGLPIRRASDGPDH